MAFEELLNQVGGLGKFHFLQMALILTIYMTLMPHVILENFTAAIPGHRCWVHLLDNDTISGALNQNALLRISIPLDSNLRPEKCRRFIQPQWQLLHLNGTFFNTNESNTEPCVDGWVYDRSTFPSTIVTEWDLVCDKQTKRSMVQFLYMMGMLIGGCINGPLSDRFGRKLILRCSLLLFATLGTCAAFVPTFLMYCSLRFLMGCLSSAIMANNGLLITEWIRSQSKTMVVTAISSFLSIGQIILGGLAYVFQEWRTLQLVTSVPFFIFFLISRWFIESARWLITTNKPEQGLKALRKVACINGIKDAGDTLNIEVVRVTMQQELVEAQKNTSMFDLFRTPNLRKRICILSFVRSAIIVPFYGIVINLQYFGSNIFLFQVLFGIVTTSARFLGFFALRHFGHRLNQIILFSLVGILILLNIFVPQEMQIPRVALASVAVSLVSIAMCESGIHFLELIPTVIRARALGIDTISSRCGAVLAPLLMTLVVYHPSLPWIAYAIFPILAALLVFFLPETRNQPLLDTINDVEKNQKTPNKGNIKDSYMKVTKF
ncbi:solute carrier family 22 member 10-like [Suncus etruscus]|uniref:solute carrier family 22 member 10-like n=1 Tax=Suncus etruscus TaxID=109475 RepID=UPI00210FD8E9|nr:solute carrier family 22 member 10-like [Suncus etruscus]